MLCATFGKPWLGLRIRTLHADGQLTYGQICPTGTWMPDRSLVTSQGDGHQFVIF